MTNGEKINSSLWKSSNYNSAKELIDAGLYEQAFKLLNCWEGAHNVEEQESKLVTPIIDTARHLFSMCLNLRDQAKWHKNACLEVAQREQQLKDELCQIVQNLNGFTNPVEDTTTTVDTSLKIIVEDEPKDSPISKAIQQSDENTQLNSSDLEQEAPSLIVYCLSQFRVYQDDLIIQGWPNCKGKSVFKYLLTHRKQPVPKEILMDIFWPNIDADAARNNLNVAIYGLRKALSSKQLSYYSHVLFQEGCYLLNPELTIWVDAEVFLEHFQAGRQHEKHGDMGRAVQSYRAAEALYQSGFLAEDRYDEWLLPTQQEYESNYLKVLESLSQYYSEHQDYDACIAVCNKMLTVDSCNEASHRQLMRCYARQGQSHLAIRQYHFCIEALSRELQMSVSQETLNLLYQIRRRQLI